MLTNKLGSMGPRITMGLYPNCVSFIHVVVVDSTLNLGVDNVEERHPWGLVLQKRDMVSGCSSFTCLKQTRVFEWCVIMQGHQKDTCLKETGPRA